MSAREESIIGGVPNPAPQPSPAISIAGSVATLAPFFQDALPSQPDPWLSKCVQRWRLTAPYELTCSEEHWRKYYQERAALEFLTKAYQGNWLNAVQDPHGAAAAADGDEPDEQQQEEEEEVEQEPQPQAQEQDEEEWLKGDFRLPEPAYMKKYRNKHYNDDANRASSAKVRQLRWCEDFDPPQLKPFCRQFDKWCRGPYPEFDSYCNECGEFVTLLEGIRGAVERRVSGCRGIQDVGQLAGRLAGGLYVLQYGVQWEASCQPRTIVVQTRLYSAAATTRSVELQMRWHFRMGWSANECFNQALLVRRGSCKPHSPQSTATSKAALVLYDMQELASGYQDRTFITQQELKQVQQVLLGCSGVMSSRKVAMLLAAAAGTGRLCSSQRVTAASLNYVDRLMRRIFKLQDGEDSDARSADDGDSDNESMRPPGYEQQCS